MAWNSCCKPTWLGGLGVRNMQLQGLALRVRWEWLRRTDPERPWQGLPMVVDKEARAVFDSMVHLRLGWAIEFCSREIDGFMALRLKTLNPTFMLWWTQERSTAARLRKA